MVFPIVFAPCGDQGFPMMLKSRFGAYDGRGNAVVQNATAIPTAWKKLGGHDGKKLYVPWPGPIYVIKIG